MSAIPRPEHPRPYFQREPWLNLNGSWRFAFDPKAEGIQQRWYLPGHRKDLQIVVPYPWESRLSGVAAPDYRGAAWYEREVTIPADWQGLAPYLNFGAIDWHAMVWVNGRLVAENDNGYLPFAADLSSLAKPGDMIRITVRAYDIADASTLVGKQVPRWYTYSSGIWQTVWLEGRAPSHLTRINVAPNVAQSEAAVQVDAHVAQPGEYILRFSSPDGAFPAVEKRHALQTGKHTLHVALAVPEPALWSPESPFLYNLVAEWTLANGGPADRVETYFGMRTISRGKWNGKSYEYILLNGEPVYLRGALDQAFHPDSIHAYPSDDVIRGDIELAKEFGLNTLRCHIKINDPRYYYWADKLGLLILYDMPCPDVDSPSMRRTFREALQGAVHRDFNSPSILAWILFNETWGLSNHDTVEGHRYVQSMVHEARQLDPTRLVEDNSPNKFDHVETDINSWHYYINNYWRVRKHIEQVVHETYPGSTFNYVGGEFAQDSAPLINSEYGGIAARSGDLDIAWSFKYHTTQLRRHDKICGYVYTELDDIEWEHNGFVNYDRSRKEFGYDFFVPDMSLVDLNSPDFVGVDADPGLALAPGAEFSAPLFVSHWGPPMSGAQVRWQVHFIDRFGDSRQVSHGEIPVQPERYSVTSLGNLAIALPDENGLATVALWLEDGNGTVRCRNYANIAVHDGASPAVEQLDHTWVLRFTPGEYAHVSNRWMERFVEMDVDKFGGVGSGWVGYELRLPESLPADQVRRIRLRFEAGARAGMAKVDWLQRTYGIQYPQTEEKKFPTELVISINGIEVGRTTLPDDPADARGVLSHRRAIDPGSYGYLTEIDVTEEQTLTALRRSLAEAPSLTVRFSVPADAKHPGGLSLYGETLGSYPISPMLLLDLTDGVTP